MMTREMPRGWPRYASALTAISGTLIGSGVAQIVIGLLGLAGSSWQLGAALAVLGFAGIAWCSYATSFEQNWKRDRKRRGLAVRT